MTKNEFWGLCNGRPNKKPENLPAGTLYQACGAPATKAGELICPSCHRSILPKIVPDLNRKKIDPLIVPKPYRA